MATTIISTDQSSGVVTVAIGTGDNLIVQPDVLIYSTAELAIAGGGQNDILLREGATILSYTNTGFLPRPVIWAGYTTPNDNKLTVLEGASVLSTYEGVRFDGARNEISNFGLIKTEYTSVLMTGSLNSLFNHGDISSEFLTAVHMGSSAEIQNFGSITSAVNGFGAANNGIWIEGANGFVTNAGDITGYTGIFFDGLANFNSTAELTNTGTINGKAIGVATADEGSRFINTGTITSTISFLATISHNASDPDEEHFLRNDGQIISAGLAYLGGAGEDRIVNTGTVIGDIQLSGGDDTYMGRSGNVDGDVEGGDGNDMLIGGAEANALKGDDGNDGLYGLGGIDELDGGDGNDQLFGGEGTDFGEGGLGDDMIRGGAGDDWFFGGAGNDIMLGGDGHDEMDGEDGNDTLRMGAGDDTAEGRAGQDIIHGGAGDDILGGGTSSDKLFGGNGDDTINGGAGADLINGGRGNDELTGGNLSDTFVFQRDAGFDTITDFQDGVDKIDLRDFGIPIPSYAAVVAPALSDAGGGDTLLDLSAFGGVGSVLIEGLAFVDADASDFLL